LNALKIETQNRYLEKQSKLQTYQKELESVQGRGKTEEDEKNLQEDKKKNVVRECSQVVSSIKNIFGRCVSSMKNNPLTHFNKDATLQESLDASLDVILDRITDLRSILSEHNQYQSGLFALEDSSVHSADGKEMQATSASGKTNTSEVTSNNRGHSSGGLVNSTSEKINQGGPSKSKPARPVSESDAKRHK
jgi:hypothetical protein